jgi:hypothetical protein
MLLQRLQRLHLFFFLDYTVRFPYYPPRTRVVVRYYNKSEITKRTTEKKNKTLSLSSQKIITLLLPMVRLCVFVVFVKSNDTICYSQEVLLTTNDVTERKREDIFFFYGKKSKNNAHLFLLLFE